MNWDAIGAVGEIIGAIGVILTLFYLAFQIRQNTKAVKGQTIGTVTQNVLTELMPFVGSNLAETWLKALDDPSQLSKIELANLDSGWSLPFKLGRTNLHSTSWGR